MFGKSSSEGRRPGSQADGVLASLRKIEEVGLVLCGVVLLIVLVLSAATAVERDIRNPDYVVGLRMLGISAATTVCAMSIGAVLGFLFGIPKLLQRSAASGTEAAGSQGAPPPATGKVEGRPTGILASNTSLEEISDWLTKIIIGLGLVQYKEILSQIETAAMVSASYVFSTAVPADAKAAPDGRIATAFFFCLIVTALLSTCLVIYLETRTRLTLLFLGLEAAKDGAHEVEFGVVLSQPITVAPAANDMAAAAATALREEPVASQPTAEDRKIASIPRGELQSAVELAGWASSQARAGNFQASEDALRDALQRAPDNIDVLLRLADVRRLRRNTPGYIDAIIEAGRKAPERPDVAAAALAAQLDALYLPKPEGFEKALILSDILAKTAQANEPFVNLRRAAALGQKFGYETARKIDASATRAEALAAVKRVAELAPDKASAARVTMRQLFDPATGGDPSENDLEGFKGDPAFEAVIR